MMTTKKMTMNSTPLDSLRAEIDELDTQLLALLAKRQQVVQAIGDYKQAHGIPPLDEERWQHLLQNNRSKGEALGLCPDFIHALYHLIHDYSLRLESIPVERAKSSPPSFPETLLASKRAAALRFQTQTTETPVSQPPVYSVHSQTIQPGHCTFGIQGGAGSFNEEAVRFFIRENQVADYKIEYLYTSENVLAAVARGEIMRGQCAVYNSAGGWVDETINALKKADIAIVDEFEIKIAHALMIRPDQEFSKIDTIMCHPQVFAQCKDTLARQYPHLKQVSGTGEFIDNAKTAEALSTRQLPDTVAVMGSKALAEIYGLVVLEDNLQDLKDNFTRFLHVVRA